MKHWWMLLVAAAVLAEESPLVRLSQARLLGLDARPAEAIVALDGLAADEAVPAAVRREAALARARLLLETDAPAAAATLRQLLAREPKALASLLPPRSLYPNEPDDVWRAVLRGKLETIVLPRISFDEAPIATVIDFLAARAAQLDPDGQGVAITLLTAGSPPPLTVTVTMDFDNIPLGEAIRYLCHGSGLQFRIVPGGVVIASPDTPIDDIELRVYRVDAGAFDSPVYVDEDGQQVDPQWFFTRLGIEFPYGTGMVALPRLGALLHWNTPENQRRVDMTSIRVLLKPMHIGIAASIVEVPAGALAGVAPGQLNAARVLALPPEQRRIVAGWSNVVLSGDTGTLGTEPAAAGGSLRMEPTACVDGSTIEVVLDFVAMVGAQEARIATRFTIPDGQAAAWHLGTTATGDRLLLLRVHLVNPSGQPIRGASWP